jgi:hypothetical protein
MTACDRVKEAAEYARDELPNFNAKDTLDG